MTPVLWRLKTFSWSLPMFCPLVLLGMTRMSSGPNLWHQGERLISTQPFDYQSGSQPRQLDVALSTNTVTVPLGFILMCWRMCTSKFGPDPSLISLKVNPNVSSSPTRPLNVKLSSWFPWYEFPKLPAAVTWILSCSTARNPPAPSNVTATVK